MILKVIGHIANRPPYCTQHRESTQITVQLGLIANRPTLLHTVYSWAYRKSAYPTLHNVQFGLIANRPTLLCTNYSLGLLQIGLPNCTQCTAWAYCKSAHPTVHSVQLGFIANRPNLLYCYLLCQDWKNYSGGLSQIFLCIFILLFKKL